jgi:hypothetical protein
MLLKIVLCRGLFFGLCAKEAVGERSACDHQFGERFVEMLLADQQVSVSRILGGENGSLA